jgi:hypothetical protein
VRIPPLKAKLERSLAAIGQLVGKPLRLDARGACGLRIGKGVPITVEWVGSADCVAVHTAFPLEIAPRNRSAAANSLMLSHLAGAATLGCSFWLTPQGGVMIGATLFGPTLDEQMLLEAIGRVCKLADRIERPPFGATPQEDEISRLFEGA